MEQSKSKKENKKRYHKKFANRFNLNRVTKLYVKRSV